MEHNGKIYISNSVTKSEYKHWKLDKEHDLEKAIDFFRERMNERYLSPINKLNEDDFNNGFSSMAICCLLIDTFYQFEHGVERTTRNHVCYVDFLRNHMGDVFDTREKADRFYKDIRCGILHSAQTQNGSRLTTNQEQIVQCFTDCADSPISVDVVKFEKRLNQYFNDYCVRIRTDNTSQSNFVKRIKIMFK